MSENDLVKMVMEYFQKRGDFPIRTNNTPLKGRNLHASAKGMSDIHVVLRQGKCCYIETKCTGKQSDDQKEFQRKVEMRGHTYMLVYDMDEIIKRFP